MDLVGESSRSLETTQTGIPIGDYRPSDGAHLCSLWTDPTTDRISAARFLRGLAPDECALCILETSREGESRTRAAAAELAAACASVFFTDDVHIAGGIFDPARMRAFWSDQARSAAERGSRHLRAVAEMAWVLRGCPGTPQAPAFESSLNPHLQPLPMSVVCQYGSSQFRADVLLGMVLSHPLIVIGETVFFNPFSASHERFAAHFEALKVDPAGSLTPVWAYFLSAQPSPAAAGALLCNSLPTLIPAERVVVAFEGLLSPLQLAVTEDRVTVLDRSAEQEILDVSRRLPVRVSAPWGSVRRGLENGLAHMVASFAEGAGSIVVSGPAAYSEQDERRFVTLAWHTANAIHSRKVIDAPASNHGGRGADGG